MNIRKIAPLAVAVFGTVVLPISSLAAHGGGGGGHGGGFGGGGFGGARGGFGARAPAAVGERGGWGGGWNGGWGRGRGYYRGGWGGGYGYGWPYYDYGWPYYDYGYPYYYSEPAPTIVYGRGSLDATVQRALKRNGYYRGGIDGEIGPESRSAIRAYQADHGLPVTGRVDNSLLRSLRL